MILPEFTLPLVLMPHASILRYSNEKAISPNLWHDRLDPTCIADRLGGAYVAYSTFDESFQLDAMLARVDTFTVNQERSDQLSDWCQS